MHYAGKNHERRARNFLQIWSVEKNLPMPKKKDEKDLSKLKLNGLVLANQSALFQFSVPVLL